MKGGERNRRRLIVGGRIIDSEDIESKGWRQGALDCLLLSRVIYFVAILEPAFIGEEMSSGFLSTGNLVLIIMCVISSLGFFLQRGGGRKIAGIRDRDSFSDQSKGEKVCFEESLIESILSKYSK